MIIEREFDMKDGVKNCINKVLEDIDNISMGLEVFCVILDKGLHTLHTKESLKCIYENQYFKKIFIRETKTDFEVYLPETGKVWDRYNSNRIYDKIKNELRISYLDDGFKLSFKWKVCKMEDMYKEDENRDDHEDIVGISKFMTMFPDDKE